MKTSSGSLETPSLLLDSCEGSRRKLSIKTIILATGCPEKNPESWPQGIPLRRGTHRRHHGDKDAEKERSLVLGKVEALDVSDSKQPWNGFQEYTDISGEEGKFFFVAVRNIA